MPNTARRTRPAYPVSDAAAQLYGDARNLWDRVREAMAEADYEAEQALAAIVDVEDDPPSARRTRNLSRLRKASAAASARYDAMAEIEVRMVELDNLTQHLLMLSQDADVHLGTPTQGWHGIHARRSPPVTKPLPPGRTKASGSGKGSGSVSEKRFAQ